MRGTAASPRTGGGLALLWALATVVACRPAVRQYDLLQQPITCEEANDLVFRSMRAMGFEITRFDLARPGHPGRIAGVRQVKGPENRTQHGTVTIRCTDAGVDLIASEQGRIGQTEMKRGFLITYKSLLAMAEREAEARAARGTADRQQRQGLQVQLEPLAGFASKLDFGMNLSAGGVLPVRVTIRNGTGRAYRLDPARIRLVAAGRKRVGQLSAAEAARLLAAARDPETGQPLAVAAAPELERRLGERWLRARRIAPGEEKKGFLYFPAGSYSGARVVLTDEASGEAEGFLVQFREGP